MRSVLWANFCCQVALEMVKRGWWRPFAGERELACYGAGSEDVAGGAIVEGVDLALVQSLADYGEIERGVVDAPADGNF